MPKVNGATHAPTLPDEVDELADDTPQLSPTRANQNRAAKGEKRRTLSGNGNSANAIKPSRSRPQMGKAESSTTAGAGQSGSRARTRTTEADENDGARAAAATMTGGAASLARFRYAGPSAGSHQRIDPTTLSDTMTSSDPAIGDNLAGKARRPPKRVHVDQAAEPRKGRTPPYNRDGHKRETKRKEEPVFVFPELDEDGNPIEEELSDSPGEAALSSTSSPAQLTTADATDAMLPVGANSPITLRSPSKPSRPADLPPSSIELPNALADRIYRASPAGSNRAPDSVQAQTPVKPTSAADKALPSSAAKADSLARAPKSQRLQSHSVQESDEVERPEQHSHGTAKRDGPAPKQLSAEDLRAVAEVLEDLDSQTFSDADVDKLADYRVRPGSEPGACERTEAKGSNAPTGRDISELASLPEATESTLALRASLPPQTRSDEPAPNVQALAPGLSTAMESKPLHIAPAANSALPASARLVHLKPPRRLPSPPPRPASYRLVGNSLDGAIAHLRDVFGETVREARSQTHEVAYLRNETNRLADELESRDAAIGELLDEKRALRKKLDEAQRREADFNAERSAWDTERTGYEQRIDVLKEIRRGLLDDLRAIQNCCGVNDASPAEERDSPETTEGAEAAVEDAPAPQGPPERECADSTKPETAEATAFVHNFEAPDDDEAPTTRRDEATPGGALASVDTPLAAGPTEL